MALRGPRDKSFRAEIRSVQRFLKRIDNSPDEHARRFAAAARNLLSALGRQAEEIPAHLGTVWEASIRFASFLLRDKALRRAGSRDPEPLPDDIHDAFDDLVGSVAPWVRRYPGARELDDERGSFLKQPALFEPAARVIGAARSADLLTPHADAMMAGVLETADGPDPAQAEKARAFSFQVARGMVTRSASYAAGFLAGAIASGYANESPLMKRIGAFMARVETDATALVADLPRDIQHAVGRMLKRASDAEFPGKPGTSGVPATTVAPPPPEGFMDEVKAMILRGEAPPEAWRPHIVTLKIGVDYAYERDELDQRAKDFADLRPLAGLWALRELFLGYTSVSDVTCKSMDFI